MLALAAAALVLSSCGLHDASHGFAELDPPDLVPAESPDVAAYYGIGPVGTASDVHGEYTTLGVIDPKLAADLSQTTFDEAAHLADPVMVQAGAEAAVSLMVSVILDSPLVFDDSVAAHGAFWDLLLPLTDHDDVFTSFFIERADSGPFSMADDDRGGWREAEGYGPAPYEEGVPRLRVRYLAIESVKDASHLLPGALAYRINFSGSRPVVLDSGEQATERIETAYTVSLVQRADGSFDLLGLAFWGDAQVGMYVTGGSRGLPPAPALEGRPEPIQLVDDGSGLILPIPADWDRVSRPNKAEDRGILMSDPEHSDATLKYIEGPVAESSTTGEPPYLFTNTFLDVEDTSQTKAEAAIDADGVSLPGVFVASDAPAGHITLPGADSAWLACNPSQWPDEYDVIDVRVSEPDDQYHMVMYFLEPGSCETWVPIIARYIRLAKADNPTAGG